MSSGALADLTSRAGVLGRIRPPVLAAERTLPVTPDLRALLPGGLRRGSTVTVSGSTSLALRLAAGASEAGSWCAAVGLPALGLVAAAEAGISLERFALVPHPGDRWPEVVAALVDGMDVVLVGCRPRGGVARRLAARARERGSVLVALTPWEGADVRLVVEAIRWSGLGGGWGHLRERRILVRAEGRGAPRQAVVTSGAVVA